jgi:hypothetical protein
MLCSIEVGELAAGGGKAEAAAAGALRRAVGLPARRPPQRQGRAAETRARPWDPPAGESCRCGG